jgi:hypothetical protein
MKATKLLIAAAVFSGTAALSFAGPGPDYWARMNAAQKQAASSPSIGQNNGADTKAAPATQSAAEVAGSCTACKECQAKKS